MIINARSSGDGGGSHTHSNIGNIHDGKLRLEHQAEAIIYIMRDRLHIGKSRYGEVGDVTPEVFLDLVLRSFARQIYNDIAEVFQQGLIDEIQKAISKVLIENSFTKEIEYDPFRRTRSGDGT